ncbi:MAG TPA: hypothetical protein VM619_11565 [Luteimonas sp.]|nr:hypothetical protein [Luteimonas sp.]
MNIYTGLLFNHGHLLDAALARSLAASGDGDGQSAAPARPEARRRVAAGRGCPPRVFRRGAIASVCSVALSPFR